MIVVGVMSFRTLKMCGVSGRAYTPKYEAFRDMPHTHPGETLYI